VSDPTSTTPPATTPPDPAVSQDDHAQATLPGVEPPTHLPITLAELAAKVNPPIKRHHLSQMFGDMSPEDYGAFCAGIRTNPGEVVLYDGRVADGYHRYVAEYAAGIPSTFLTLAEWANQHHVPVPDILDFVVDRNKLRRQHDPLLVGVELKHAYAERARLRQLAGVKVEGEKGRASDLAAAQLGNKISGDTIDKADKLLTENPDLKEDLQQGKTTWKKARKTARTRTARTHCGHGNFVADCSECCKHGKICHTCISCRDTTVTRTGTKQRQDWTPEPQTEEAQMPLEDFQPAGREDDVKGKDDALAAAALADRQTAEQLVVDHEELTKLLDNYERELEDSESGLNRQSMIWARPDKIDTRYTGQLELTRTWAVLAIDDGFKGTAGTVTIEAKRAWVEIGRGKAQKRHYRIGDSDWIGLTPVELREVVDAAEDRIQDMKDIDEEVEKHIEEEEAQKEDRATEPDGGKAA
jgi:hypothetical protein